MATIDLTGGPFWDDAKPAPELARVSILTARVPQCLSKKFQVARDSTIEKLPGGQFVDGDCHVVSIANLTEFGDVLTTLNSAQALAYGLPPEGLKRILSRNKYERAGKPRDAFTRTNDHFTYAQKPGIMMLDYDPLKDGSTPLSCDKLVAAIRRAVPGLMQAQFLWWPSASSCIFKGTEEIFGVRGQRLYLLVENAADIPRAGKVLVERLWQAGHGHVEVSKSGAILERTLVDGSVWQPSRLDFAGGAHCVPPLRQDRGDPILIAGELECVDTKTVFVEPSPGELADIAKQKSAAKEAAAPQVQKAREAWLDARVEEMLLPEEADDPEARDRARQEMVQVLDGGGLCSAFLIHVENNGRFEPVSVSEMLEDPGRYHGKRTLDPIEPDYGSRKAVGKLFLLQRRPTLHSFAHGGKTYRLYRAAVKIKHVRGHTSEAVDEVLQHMRRDPLVFDYGGALVLVADGKLHVLEEHTLANYLGQNVQMWRTDRDGAPADIDPTRDLLRQILSLGDRRGLKPLVAVVTSPVALPNGSILTKPGYDSGSRLFFDPQEDDILPEILTPSIDEGKEALDFLMKPFEDFPFVDPLAKGAMLAALLTAIERPVLPTAPAMAFDAPVQGSGKTLLAQCVSFLASGQEPLILPHTHGRDDEEVRKRLLSALIHGAPALVWDNVTGSFDSAAMAAFLTTPALTDRILGKSQMVQSPNRALTIFTGNNITFEGDMPRRVIKCRIDPQSATPFDREFPLDPLEYVRTHRMEMAAAACTIIRAHQCSGAKRAKGRMASFEIWDDLVRQTVVWAGTALAPGEFGDPMQLVYEAQAADTGLEALVDLLTGLSAAFGSKWFTSNDVFDLKSSAVNEALSDVDGTDVAQNARRIGKLLARHKDKVVNGMRLVARSSNAKAAVSYRVELVSTG